jgi:hypothetical protein
LKLILCQPAIPRFQWELDVLLTNIRQFSDIEVILLFSEHNFAVPIYFRKKYGCSVFVYPDRRDNKFYIPSIRPYLWWQYLKEHPEAEAETYLYTDSDIIYREWPDFAGLGVTPQRWVASDCSGYIGYDYIMRCQNGARIAERMAQITGITLDQLKATVGAGAQWVIDRPTATFWERAYRDSNAIRLMFEGVDSDIQQWTAEMWAQLYGMVREGVEVAISHELDFCLPTDPIGRWDEVKIMHNAGVTESGELFFKGEWDTRSPLGQDFSHVRRDRVSAKYVEAMGKVVL